MRTAHVYSLPSRVTFLPRSYTYDRSPLHPDYLRRRDDARHASSLPGAPRMNADNVVRALASVGIDARILPSGLVDLGCTPCDGEYSVRARVSPDGSAELHVLTNGRAELTEATEYGTYETARALAEAASNVMND